MFEFLFDIKPDAGNVCPTTRLAYLISERGNKVYYTDTSDSVFTTGLLRKGIGRIIYPHDFRWFTPHLALLDYQLQDKQQVYNEYDINYLFIAINKTDRKIDLMPEMPVVTLPPIPYKLLPQGAKDDDFIDKLTEIKEDRSRTVIIGLLEDEEEERKVNTPSHMESFYKAMKQSASIHPQYQFILLTNHGEVETRLFSLPPNIAIYRLPRLQALLPLCDMALITGGIGYSPAKVALPYQMLTLGLNAVVLFLSVGIVIYVRNSYMDMIEKLFPQLEEGNLGPAMVIGILLFVGVSLFNIIAVRRKVASIWMHKG